MRTTRRYIKSYKHNSSLQKNYAYKLYIFEKNYTYNLSLQKKLCV
jgi:hypothetical protein